MSIASPDNIDLRKLNSATKYPSIPTYHQLDPASNGRLLESGNPFADHDGPVYITEKVDGVNARIICIDDDWFIGSREELLTARGDRVPNPTLGIVDALCDVAGGLWVDTGHKIYVYFVEVYGLKPMPGWKIYGDGSKVGVRLFDVAEVPLGVLKWPIEQIAAWRDRGGQAYEISPVLSTVRWGLETVPQPLVVPSGKDLPADLQGMRDFLGHWLPLTRAAIDKGAATPVNPEGAVLRTADRSIIVKARFQDYDRTLSPDTRRAQRQMNMGS